MIDLLYKTYFYKKNDLYIRDKSFFYIKCKTNKCDIDHYVKISFIYQNKMRRNL